MRELVRRLHVLGCAGLCAALAVSFVACGKGKTNGNASGGTVTQLMGWQLNETNTGLAGVGIDKNALALYDPPSSEVQYGTWYVPANTVLREKRIELGAIVLSAGNITIERCWFHPSTIGKGMPLIHNEQKPPDLPNVIRDSDLDGTSIALNSDGTNPACGGIGISTVNVQIERCNIQGFGSGVALGGEYPASMEGTYIHDLVQGEWVLDSGQSHQDGFTIRSFGGTSASIKNNRILVNPPTKMATGALFLQATWTDSFIDNISIEGNLLEGYGYNLGLDRGNGGYGSNLRVINNRFDPWTNTGGWIGAAYIQHGGPGWAEWTNNYRNDPTQVDNKGAPVAEPMTQANSGLTAPSNLQATPISSGSLSLSWSDNSDNEMGFRVERSLDGVTFASTNITDADAASYVDTGLAASTTYYYRIAAANSDGMSGYSNVASAATPSP